MKKTTEERECGVWMMFWAMLVFAVGFNVVQAIGNDIAATPKRYLVIDLFDATGRYLRTDETFTELEEICVVDGVICDDTYFTAPALMWVDLDTGVVVTIHFDGDGRSFAITLDEDSTESGTTLLARAVYVELPNLTKEREA